MNKTKLFSLFTVGSLILDLAILYIDHKNLDPISRNYDDIVERNK